MFEVLPSQDNLDNDLKLNVYMSVYKYRYMYLYIFMCVYFMYIFMYLKSFLLFVFFFVQQNLLRGKEAKFLGGWQEEKWGGGRVEKKASWF